MSAVDVVGQQPDATMPLYPYVREADFPFDPPLEVREPGQAPRLVTIWNGQTAWLFSRYDHVQSLLADSRVSHDTDNPSYPHESAGFMERARQGQSFINMDDPEHGRLRRMASPALTAKRTMALRETIQRQVDELIDNLLAGPKPVDLVTAFSLPLPSLMICLLLGVPTTEQGRFQRAVDLIIRRDTPPEMVAEVQGKLFEYLEDLIRSKIHSPSEDLLSDLATKNVATGELTVRQAAVTARLLLAGGHETTANTISLGVAILLQHPEQLEELRSSEDPALLVSAVEEVLRYTTIAHVGMRRFATADIEIDGHHITAGDSLILSIDGGNRTPEVYPEPDEFDIHRDARGQLGFGWGAHGCIGQSLARLELQIALGTLFRRIPTLELVKTISELDFKHDSIGYGVYSLPVTW